MGAAGFLLCGAAAPYTAPLCKGSWRPCRLRDCHPKTAGKRGFPAEGSDSAHRTRDSRRGRGRRFPLRGTGDSRAMRGPASLCGQRPRFLPPPRGVLPSPPFSFVPHCAQRSGGPFLFHRLRSPHTGAPCVGRRTRGAAQMGRGGFAAEKRTGRWSGPREKTPGAPRLNALHEARMGPWTPTIAALLRKRNAAPHRGPRAI